MNFVAFRPTQCRSGDEPLAAEVLSRDHRSLSKGLRVLGVHSAFYLGTMAGALAPLPVALNIFFGVANGVFIALLFIIGHDAAHGSFVPGRSLNRFIARIAFVPCVHAASLWRVVHNELHHGRTNLKGVDGVWAPMSIEEYRSASLLRRWVERVYRGPAGPLIYYYLEFWIHRVLIPIAPEARKHWKRHLPDSAFALAGFCFTLGCSGLTAKAFVPDRPLWLVLLVGWVLPFAVWNYLMAFTTYLNHTHPLIPWFQDETSWSLQRGVLTDTASVRMPINVAPLYTKVMAHTVHHLQPRVPVYALLDVQAQLKNSYRGLLEYTLAFGEYRAIYKTCKLFDFQAMCWTDFDGIPTAWPLRDDLPG